MKQILLIALLGATITLAAPTLSFAENDSRVQGNISNHNFKQKYNQSHRQNNHNNQKKFVSKQHKPRQRHFSNNNQNRRQGFNNHGYNSYGFNKHGYNRHGFNRHGFNRHGYTKLGFNRHGFNKHGYNQHGYNKHGYTKLGFNRHGFNKHGYNQHGYNKHGYTKLGFNRHGFNKHGYNQHGYNKHGYTKLGFNRHGFNKHGYNQHGYNKHGYNEHGYNKHGYTKHKRKNNHKNKPSFSLAWSSNGSTITYNQGHDDSGYANEHNYKKNQVRRIYQRLNIQEKRIHHGINNGQLVAHEIKKLKYEQRHIKQTLASYNKDGHMNKYERSKLNHLLDVASENIHHKINNQLTRYSQQHKNYVQY